MKKLESLAIVGATGLVGQTFLDLLNEGFFPGVNIYLVASKKSKGKEIQVRGKNHIVSSLEEFDFSSIDLAFFSAGATTAEIYAPKAVKQGCVVIDNSSFFRYKEDVPLIVPEVNASDLKKNSSGGLIANPNCSTIQMLTAIKPIHDEFIIERIDITTFQAVSGTGKEAEKELISQSSSKFTDVNLKLNVNVYKKPIAFNVIPECGEFQENRYTEEEMKLVWETKKIMDSSIQVNATCVRVPVINGHSESIHLKTKKDINLDKVLEILKNKEGLSVFYGKGPDDYPTPLTDSNGKNNVFVGRLRKDLWDENRLNLWVVADNLRKGAALNSFQIAKLLFH
tara:strand:- start:12502 stop:13518 length:1017 start_codon:yes stop_codon:yes gene_type:complete